MKNLCEQVWDGYFFTTSDDIIFLRKTGRLSFGVPIPEDSGVETNRTVE